jgi:hypothetical protein
VTYAQNWQPVFGLALGAAFFSRLATNVLIELDMKYGCAGGVVCGNAYRVVARLGTRSGHAAFVLVAGTAGPKLNALDAGSCRSMRLGITTHLGGQSKNTTFISLNRRSN